MNACSTYPCHRTSAGCPVCDPTPQYSVPPAPTFTPQGCICPPTSEKTCESISCPRKNPFKNFSLSGAVLGSPEQQDRKTFTIPPGHEAVRDSEGRATGEVRPISPAVGRRE